jgi:hypothetical protein
MQAHIPKERTLRHSPAKPQQTLERSMRPAASKILPFQREHHLAIVSNWPVAQERGSKVRYPQTIRFRRIV